MALYQLAPEKGRSARCGYVGVYAAAWCVIIGVQLSRKKTFADWRAKKPWEASAEWLAAVAVLFFMGSLGQELDRRDIRVAVVELGEALAPAEQPA